MCMLCNWSKSDSYRSSPAHWYVSTEHQGWGADNGPEQNLLDCWVDSNFRGNWAKECDILMLIMYNQIWLHYQLCWSTSYLAFKATRRNCLSMTEAEFYSLSMSLSESIPLIALMKEFVSQCICDSIISPQVHCHVFEDNSGALEMANNQVQTSDETYCH